MPKMARNRSALHDVLAQGASNRDITVVAEILERFSFRRLCMDGVNITYDAYMYIVS